MPGKGAWLAPGVKITGPKNPSTKPIESTIKKNSLDQPGEFLLQSIFSKRIFNSYFTIAESK